MKPRFLGKTICLLLRSHKWRRLRKAESTIVRISHATDHVRICSRCGLVRAVKTRMPKVAT